MTQQLTPPSGHGVVRVGHNLREVVGKAQDWGLRAGTDFWLVASAESFGADTDAHELADYGWTTTALTLTAGSAADFLSSSDVGTPNRVVLADASDVLQSPALFGDYSHGLIAQAIMGRPPIRLVLEAYAAFTTVTNNETATCFGFVEDGGSVITANDALATIFSDGTNFGLRSGAASDTGALVDTSWHIWKIVLDSVSGNAEWFIDGTSQGTIAIETDEFPAAFGAGVVGAGSNDLALSWAHIWYE